MVEHKIWFMKAEFECGFCHKMFPMYYTNKGNSYYGDRGRYNWRGAQANFNKHTKCCEKKVELKSTKGAGE